jgi:hypothetical protein
MLVVSLDAEIRARLSLDKLIPEIPPLPPLPPPLQLRASPTYEGALYWRPPAGERRRRYRRYRRYFEDKLFR